MRLRQLFTFLRYTFGLPDLAFLAGLWAFGYGFYLIDLRYAFIAVGFIVVLLTTIGRFVK